MVVLDMMNLAQWHMVTSITPSVEFEFRIVEWSC